ncbi:MAG: c-type cytochrome biogenesis protein CcmI [Enterobacteriaceae bacterium]
MLIFWLLVILLLAAGIALLLSPLWRGIREDASSDRNTMNTHLYQQRLQELQQETLAESPDQQQALLSELQHTLLQDIPAESLNPARPVPRLWLLPGVLLLPVIALGLYFYTGSPGQVTQWQQVSQQLPQLRQRLQHEQQQPLSAEEVARLGLALRTWLQQHPDQWQDWMLLGRIGIWRGDVATATQSFERAYHLVPQQPEVKLEYAQVLLRSSDTLSQQQGQSLLRELLLQQPGNIRVLSLLAFTAFERGEFRQAIDSWSLMLKLLPAEDSRREIILRSIEQAQQQLGE